MVGVIFPNRENSLKRENLPKTESGSVPLSHSDIVSTLPDDHSVPGP